MKNTYVRFERGRDGVIGPTLGPFDFVQVTYGEELRDDQGCVIAEYGTDDGNNFDWWLTDRAQQVGFDNNYSDFIIYAGETFRSILHDNFSQEVRRTNQTDT